MLAAYKWSPQANDINIENKTSSNVNIWFLKYELRNRLREGSHKNTMMDIYNIYGRYLETSRPQ